MDDQILENLRILKSSMVTVLKPLEEIYPPPADGQFIEVKYRPREEIIEGLRDLIVAAEKKIEAGITPCFPFLVRTESTQVFSTDANRYVLKKKAKTKVREKNQRLESRDIKFMSMIKLIKSNCEKNFECNKRALLYDLEPYGIKNKDDLDILVDNLTCMLECTQESLLITSNAEGRVAGQLSYVCKGKVSTSLGEEQIIPDHNISDIKSDAAFILLVEKQTVMKRLVRDNFHIAYQCIIITGRGQPCHITKKILKAIATELKLPILGLMDCNVYGLRIFTTYRWGSKRMAHDNYRLITPDIMWLGLRPSDLGKDKYEISESQRRPRKTHENTYVTNIGREKFVISNAKWVDEVDLMKDAHNKANLESLGDSLSKTFLPKKLREADWI
ncbi:DNA topoisomerase 6 subunit A3-like [Prunus avium]|uniref:DNA topoisomerase 6 subunit A3-like n=1 Tax=Prunus avium TaxID=42229 RepID=A0A6P5SMX5_PRUAV|nr:DNA topoisomerase 6 subunit A3-like [Prunus avium]